MNTIQTVQAAAINATTIESVVAMRQSLKELENRAKLIKAALEPVEKKVMAHIEAGEDISNLGFAVSIAVSQRIVPSWKEAFLDFCGKESADLVVATTAPSITRKLVIA